MRTARWAAPLLIGALGLGVASCRKSRATAPGAAGRDLSTTPPAAQAGVETAKSEGASADDEEWVPPPTAVPFGPFLVLGALEQLLLGERLWTAWVSLLARLLP